MNFDRIATHYDWIETFTAGDLLQRVRTTHLDELAGCRRILSVGEGHGRFAAACAARFPAADITCVEASAPMLARARRRAGALAPRINWVRADVLAWPLPPQHFDAIVTCFFLDCFPPAMLAAIVARLTESATPTARWLVADFTLPAKGPARLRARAIHALMYRFFQLATGLPARALTVPDPLLMRHGFRLARARTFDWGLLQTQLWLRSV